MVFRGRVVDRGALEDEGERGSAPLAKQLPQLPERAVEACLDGRGLRAGGRRSLAQGEVRAEAQRDHLALLVAQLGERTHNLVAALDVRQPAGVGAALSGGNAL